MALDTQMLYFLNSFAGTSAVLDAVIVFGARYLPYLLVGLLLVLVAWSAHSYRKKGEIVILALAAALVARFGAAELIRFFYHRPRPFTELPVHELFTNGAWSFPSGHASFFFAMATVVFLYDRGWGTVFFAAAFLIGMARIAAGVHYPSDIFGGALVGALVGVGIAYLGRRLGQFRDR